MGRKPDTDVPGLEGSEVMAARIGRVLYWMGCIIAVLLVLLSFFFAFLAETTNGVVGGLTAFIPYAVVVWLIGRACRYFLAGD